MKVGVNERGNVHNKCGVSFPLLKKEKKNTFMSHQNRNGGYGNEAPLNRPPMKMQLRETIWERQVLQT